MARTSSEFFLYDDADWARAIIFLISPKPDPTWNVDNIDGEFTGFTEFHTVNLNSGEAFNKNEFLRSSQIEQSIIDNPETGHFFYCSMQGLFRITTPPEGLLMIIIVGVVSIVGLISLIVLIKKYSI